MSEESTITTILAIWGAVLSSFTLGWNIFRDFMQRGRLRVTCYIGHIVGNPSISHKENLLVWTVTNIGREPVVLTTVGGSFGETAFLINTGDPLPKTLAPGDYFTGYTNDLSVLEPKLKYLAAYDSLGRTFKAPKKTVKKLKEKYASGEYNSENSQSNNLLHPTAKSGG